MLESRLHKLINEAWSQKYKDSIDCSRPRGFSQKAHCDGKKKVNESLDISTLENDIYEMLGVHVELYDRGDHLVLNRVFVPSDARGVSLGTQAMEAVVDFAGKNHMDVYLTPSTSYGASSVGRLENFYKRFGFQKKPREDYKSRNSMVRYAKGNTPVNENYILKQLENDFPVELELYDHGTHLELDKIVVPRGQRSIGIGSEVLTKIGNYADEHGLPVFLTPSRFYGGTSLARLINFYKRFGFRKNEDPRDKALSRNMLVRRPQ